MRASVSVCVVRVSVSLLGRKRAVMRCLPMMVRSEIDALIGIPVCVCVGERVRYLCVIFICKERRGEGFWFFFWGGGGFGGLGVWGKGASA